MSAEAELRTAQDAAIRAEVEREPLVSALLPLDALRAEYADSPNFLAKIDTLGEEHGRRQLRRLRKDGSCFYRAVLFRLAETLAGDRPGTERLVALLPAARGHFAAAGFEPLVYEDFEAVWVSFLRAVGAGEPVAARLLDDLEQFNYLVMYLRFVTSACIRASPLLAALFEDAAALRTFCANEVEQLGAEADQPQIVALQGFFGLPLRIFYLDNAPSPALTVLSLPETVGPSAASAAAYPFQLLYRPGHYDLLYA